MKKYIIFLFFASLLFPLVTIGQEIKTSLSFSAPTIKDSNLRTNNVTIVSEDMMYGENEGLPNIPFRYIRLIIPTNSEVVSVDVNKYDFQSFNLIKKIEPIQVAASTRNENVNFIEPNTSIYSSNKAFPENMAEVVDIRKFGLNQVVFVKVYPFQYYPGSDLLEFYQDIDVSLSYRIMTGNDRQLESIHNESPSIVDKNMLFHIVDNKEDVERFAIESTPSDNISLRRGPQNGFGYEYIIITSDDLVPAFERLANWKRRKGMTVGIITMDYITNNYTGDLVQAGKVGYPINDNAGKVREFLKNSYHNGTRYVLLGGDESVVPFRYACYLNNNSIHANYIPTDFYFSELTGSWNVDNDMYYGEPNQDSVIFDQQLYVGRLLCSTKAQVENWTYKVFHYEKNPGRGNYSYLTKLFFTLADQMQASNWDTYVFPKLTFFTTKTVFRETVNGVLDHYSTTVPNYPSGSNVINEYNNNYGFVSFMGHGCSTDVALATKEHNDNNTYKLRIYTYDYIKADTYGVQEYSNGGSLKYMTNDGFPDINYSISCGNMPYDKTAPFPEDNVDDPFGKVLTSIYRTGSAAFLGNTRDGYILNSRELLYHFADGLNNGYLSLGEAENYSKTKITKTGVNRYIIFSHNILGCPQMKMWTTTPTKFTSASVIRSGTTVSVVPNVAGSKICVMSSLDNGASYYQVISNSTAQGSTFSNVPASYTVTITKDNYIPYIYATDVTIQNTTYSNGDNFINGNNFTLNNITMSGTAKLHLEPLGFFTTTGSNSLSVSGNTVFSIE